jgi:predicted NBD/HSP70 family sugar kinase
MDDRELSVLKAIYFKTDATRLKISISTHMSTVLISGILNNLEEKGYIRKGGKTKTSGGRPSILYSLNPELGYFWGISVNTDSFTVSILDSAAKLVKTVDFKLTLSSDQEEHVDNIISQIVFEIEKLIQRDGIFKKPIYVGISVPGMVDTENGIRQHGLQLTGITGVLLRDILQKRLSIPVYIEDQSRAITMYEMRNGEGKNLQNWVFLYLGSGVGAGIVINGEIYRGHKGMSGEIGHLEVDPGGSRCSCGNIGCIETILSVPSILRQFKERLDEGVMSSLQKYYPKGSEKLDLEKILTAAIEGDKLTQSILFDIGLFLGDACTKLIKILSPEKIIIGGPVSILGDFFKNPIDITFTRLLMPEMLPDKSVGFTRYNHQKTSWGAALGAMDIFWKTLGPDDLSTPESL